MRVDVEVKTGALYVFSQVAARVGFGDGPIHDVDEITILAANIDVAFVRVNGAACDQNAFDQLMRIVFHQQPILAGAGLALIRIYDDVLWLRRSPGHEAPLHAGGKTRAAASS